MTPIFADFTDTLGIACFCFLFIIGWAMRAAGQAITSVTKSDTAKDIASDVAGNVIKSWLEGWFGK